MRAKTRKLSYLIGNKDIEGIRKEVASIDASKLKEMIYHYLIEHKYVFQFDRVFLKDFVDVIGWDMLDSVVDVLCIRAPLSSPSEPHLKKHLILLDILGMLSDFMGERSFLYNRNSSIHSYSSEWVSMYKELWYKRQHKMRLEEAIQSKNLEEIKDIVSKMGPDKKEHRILWAVKFKTGFLMENSEISHYLFSLLEYGEVMDLMRSIYKSLDGDYLKVDTIFRVQTITVVSNALREKSPIFSQMCVNSLFNFKAANRTNIVEELVDVYKRNPYSKDTSNGLVGRIVEMLGREAIVNLVGDKAVLLYTDDLSIERFDIHVLTNTV